MKRLALVTLLAALGVGGFFAYRAGWLALPRAPTMPTAEKGPQPASGAAAQPQAAPLPGLSATAGVPAGVGGDAGAPSGPSRPAAEINLLAREMGGRVESVSSQYDKSKWAAERAIDGDEGRGWSTADNQPFPQDIVFSFLDHQSALLSSVVINPFLKNYATQTPKEVEIWISPDSATEGFVRVATATMPQAPGFQRVTFAPVQARYLKLRLLSNYGARDTSVAEMQAFEGHAPGYTSLVERIPGLTTVLAAATSPVVTPDAAIPGAPAAACAPASPVARPVLGSGSQNVLVIADKGDDYTPLAYRPGDRRGHVDYGFYGQAKFTRVASADATLALFGQNFDTIVLAQLCEIKTQLTDPFKRALVGWVSLGHKLIIQDSDNCGGSGRSPDYSFLPYKFATSNPGARGAPGARLLFVEENTIGGSQPKDQAFIDLEEWLSNTRNENRNEIGDSNTITQYDPQWCGHLFGTNVLKKNGFMEAYAHYGKGLIIYDGFDVDQRDGAEYRQLVTRELQQPMNPDGLACSARLGDFVLTTEQRLKQQLLTPARAYQYPLTLLSNQGYSGTITLSLTVTPPDPTMTFRFEPATVALTEIGQTALTVQTTAQTPAVGHALAVRGTDEQNRSSAVCLQLMERKTGGIRVTSAIDRPKAASKNLEIVLDVSGSMKLPLGKKTRWATALDVLKEVAATLPDDFNVGLRVYAHRQPARSNETCTDTELLVPIRKIDRSRLESSVSRLQPRGETPLIYSILKTPEDLKAAGGGSVVVITDGEDTCHGDAAAAAAQLKSSGVDVTLNIVGFTLKGRAVQDQLTTLARATGGEYYGAQSGKALARALWIATIDKMPYTILDASGTQVASGEAGGSADELPPGDYTVVVKVADQELREHVAVTPDSDTTLRIALKDDRFVVER